MKKSIDSNHKTNNKELIDKFLGFLYADGCRKNTIIAYESDLKQFEKINNFENLLEKIDEKFDFFVRNAKSAYGDKLSYTSITRKISSIKTFYNFLKEEKILNSMPRLMTNFKLSGVKRLPPKVLSKSEIESLIDGCKEKQNSKKQGDWLVIEAILTLLYSSGARVSEVLEIRINQIFNNKGEILDRVTISGKNRHERQILLNERSKSAIKKLLLYRANSTDFDKIKNSQDFLFSKKILSGNQNKEVSKADKISRQKVYYNMRIVARDVGINPEKVSPHVLRHSIAVHLLLNKNKNNISLIKSFLGHKTIETTKIYLNYENARILSDIVNKNHPLMKKFTDK
jgi:integrase/recombinase XerD